MNPTNNFLQILTRRDEISFPNFAKPSEIGHYSTDSENSISFDRSRLSSFYEPPELNLDLNDGYGRLVEQNSRIPGCLDNLLRWIVEEKRKFETKYSQTNDSPSPSSMKKISMKSLIRHANFVSWRGVLTRLAATPYDDRESWMIAAVRFRGVVFLMAIETEQEKTRKSTMTEKEKRMTYWGYRFEKYVTTKGDERRRGTDGGEENPSGPSDDDGSIDRRESPSGPVDRPGPDSEPSAASVTSNCNEQYCVVYRTKLGRSADREYRLLYGAEIDCTDPRTTDGGYLELKTSRILDNWRQERNFKRFKLLKWWIQSFLVGIDRLICGYRDDEGIVRQLKSYDVREMPALANHQGSSSWSGAVCMNFLFEFLEFVDRNTPGDGSEESLSDLAMFEYSPETKRARLTTADHHGMTSEKVLPDWFVGEFGKV